MKKTKFPTGWNEERVKRVLAYYEEQTEEEAVAEDEAAFEDQTQTLMQILSELAPMELEELRLKQAHFEPTRRYRQKHYRDLERLRQEFARAFTITRIKNMDKDDYVEGKVINGKPNKNTFCYWVEWETEELGRIQGATAYKFGLYVDKESQEYKFTKEFENEDEAIDSIREEIVRLIELGKIKDLENIKKIRLSPMFKGKILFLYFPDDFVNVFSENHVARFLREIGIYRKNRYLDLIDKRELLLKWKNSDPVMKEWTMFEFSDFLYSELGWPPKKARIPHGLRNYIDFEEDYPDPSKVRSEFIELRIAPEKIGKMDERERGKRMPEVIDFERENRRHKRLGEQGELIVFYKEKSFLAEMGQKALAERVRLVSKEDTSAGYDILSYELDGNEKRIEVKSTNNSPSETANFLITINEYNKAREIEGYYIYVVYNAKSRNPRIWRIKSPFDYEGRGLYLHPIDFQVTVNAEEVKTHCTRPNKHALHELVGTLTHEEAEEMQKFIDEEFEKIEGEW